MRPIILLLALSFMTGCDSAPTSDEINSAYEAEVQRLTVLNKQLSKLEANSVEFTDSQPDQTRKVEEMLANDNLSPEMKRQITEVQDLEKKENDLNSIEISSLKSLIEAQKLRVEEARKLKDAAK